MLIIGRAEASPPLSVEFPEFSLYLFIGEHSEPTLSVKFENFRYIYRFIYIYISGRTSYCKCST